MVHACLLASLVTLLAPPHRAAALDAQRALTQALHRIWQMQQGLPQATILRVRQTRDGYLWLATPTGLVRFDGVRFDVIDELGGTSLKGLWCRDLLEDDHGNLWIATDGEGLFRVRDGKTTRFLIGDGLPSNSIARLFSDSRGTLWIGTPSGLASFARGKFEVYRTPQGLASDDVSAVAEAKDGTIWVGGASASVSVSSATGFAPVPLRSLPRNAKVQAMLGGGDGAIWVGTTEGLVRWSTGREELLGTKQGLAGDVIFCLEAGRDGSLWVGTQGGFTRVKPNGDRESFRPQDGLSQSTVYTLCEDREGSLWAGTKHGLDQFLDRRTVPFTTSEGLPSNDAGPIFEDTGGTLWVGTQGAGLSRFDGYRFAAEASSAQLPSQDVVALAGDLSGDVWVGTDRGVSRLRGHEVVKTFTSSDGLPSDDVRALVCGAGGPLWVGTAKGLAWLDGARFTPAPGEAGRAAVKALIARADGSVIASVEGGGLLSCTPTACARVATAGLPWQDVCAFFEDRDGTLWLATRGGGLASLDRSGAPVRSVTARDGLYDDDLFAIVADAQDRLWFACSKGIFSVARADLRAFAAGKVKSVTSLPFSPTDALRTIECKSGVQPGAWRARDGRLWFSTIRGVVMIDPNKLQHDLPAPPVAVDVLVNGRPEPPAAIAALEPGVKNLEFRYTALNLQSPLRTTFKYRLEGFDRDWVDAGSRREAFYTNLPPGGYRFRVVATTWDGKSAEPASPIAFTLQPQFYQRRWFAPACAAALLALAYWAYRARVGRIRAQGRAVAAERSRIARELHDTLMQGFSGITMEMQALATQLPRGGGERATLEEIIRDAGTCLREARQSVAGLRTNVTTPAGPTNLAHAIERETRQIAEDRGARLRLRLDPRPPALAADVQYNLLRIATEAVTNAVKHAHCRLIEVTLHHDAEQLTLIVRDDGVGFTPSTSPGPGHYGLIGMKERAAQINATIDVDGKPSRGTVVRVDLPLAPGAAAADDGDDDKDESVTTSTETRT